MSRKAKIWLLGIGLCLVAGFVGLGVSIYRRIRVFATEDLIHATFHPLATALYRYQDEEKHPAESISSLIPKYLDAIPVSPLADPPKYSVSSDGQSWELVIPSRALPQPRLYICRSTQAYTPEEMRRIILQYHGTWAVFPADK